MKLLSLYLNDFVCECCMYKCYIYLYKYQCTVCYIHVHCTYLLTMYISILVYIKKYCSVDIVLVLMR